MSQPDGLEIKKMDYLQGKYVFRYPYTFTSIKWGLTLGSFFGIHTYVKTKNIRYSFINWMQKTLIFTFAVWAYFYAKYNFYQNSINMHEQEEQSKVREANFMKHYMQYKLKIPLNSSYSQQQLLERYERYIQQQYQRYSQLNIMLQNITASTFDGTPSSSNII